MHQWTNWEGVLESVRATAMSRNNRTVGSVSMRSIPRCYTQDMSDFSEWRESPASRGVNMEAAVLEAVTRQ
jgi:hypothetical protein